MYIKSKFVSIDTKQIQNTLFKYFVLILFSAMSCQKPLSDINEYFPKIETLQASLNQDGSILIKGKINSIGASPITYAGFCASTNINPEIVEHQKNAYISGDTFYALYENLSTDSTYYFKSFAANTYGYSTGNVVSFSLKSIAPPKVILPCNIPIDTISLNGAIYSITGGKITDGSYSGPYIDAVSYSGPRLQFFFNDNIDLGVGKYVIGQHVRVELSNSWFLSTLLNAGDTIYVNSNDYKNFELTICQSTYTHFGANVPMHTRFSAFKDLENEYNSLD